MIFFIVFGPFSKMPKLDNRFGNVAPLNPPCLTKGEIKHYKSPIRIRIIIIVTFKTPILAF